ncbi:caspase-1-like [Cottoperca gobio]|uniref:Caspase-1-like n=1 Tax=Cottoperca gobio TaxID=56716 RepID=A0A6J2QVW5_COTGO|nr:caspase-1-like [Cottoperca gobio]XP_029301871.1 caspase-1-like [Cottoperca gobio]XP_029301872.1 caspase-1-like [Cottoperca gobio]XP_029301873.1 caspase-1-like [Cottoperca gobio]
MADKELARVRSKFVEKVSNELIKQLLDDLLEDRVLNDGQKDSVLEENNSRANKARALIDTVKMKGDLASRKMIDHLQDRDAELHFELGLSSGQPAQPAADPQMKKEGATSEASWEEKMKAGDVYPVSQKSIRYRVALLITNIKFTNENMNRDGAEKDEENMDKLLNDLGYEVVKHRNLTGQAINDAVIEFSKHRKLKETDSVMVVIMSHGKLGAVLGVDWKNNISGDEKPDEFLIDNIYMHLNPEKCPALQNKPKIIIIQGCRGEKGGSVFVRDALFCDDASAAEENFEEDTMRAVNKEKDFISLLSCTPDTVSYRQRDLGSLLIQYLVEVLKIDAQKDDIEELFRKVMKRFEDFAMNTRRQMATKDRVTLTKRFYFFPGL